MEKTEQKVRIKDHQCPYCHDDVQVGDRSVCSACLATHHPDCWKANSGCATGPCDGKELVASNDKKESPSKRRHEVSDSLLAVQQMAQKSHDKFVQREADQKLMTAQKIAFDRERRNLFKEGLKTLQVIVVVVGILSLFALAFQSLNAWPIFGFTCIVAFAGLLIANMVLDLRTEQSDKKEIK